MIVFVIAVPIHLFIALTVLMQLLLEMIICHRFSALVTANGLNDECTKRMIEVAFFVAMSHRFFLQLLIVLVPRVERLVRAGINMARSL